MSLQNKYSQCLKGNLDIGQRMTLSEEGVNLYIISSKHVDVSHVDNCIITSNNKRCDYMIYCKESTKFIELKGIDIEHACDQIYDTICFFENDEDLCEVVNNADYLMGYIASLRPSVPAITNIHMKKACDKLFSKSRKKLESLFDHLIFVRCVSKLSSNYSSNGKRQILVNNSHPLEV